MKITIKNEILKDKQILKFKLYGFFKNLKFFEPFLLIFLINNNISLLKIGFLISIRELIVNIFEIPSGIIADYFGKKKQLYLCFLFYIVSFIVFFFTKDFLSASFAMILYGLAEAFRSGSHKALIYNYLDIKGWKEYKTFVYGRTRSASLFASAISSLIAIFFYIYTPSLNYIFLISILPYLFDLCLIISYPNSIDSKIRVRNKTTLQSSFKNVAISIYHKKELNKLIISNGIFEASIASIKDYIQPIIQTVLIISPIIFLNNIDKDTSLAIILGISYFIINIIGSIGSRESYKLIKHFCKEKLINHMYLSLIIFFILLSITVKYSFFVIILFLLIYLVRDLRKPIFIDIIDNYMDKSERATVLSLVSQIKSGITIIIAPLMGFIADNYGTSYSFLALSLFLIIFYIITHKKIIIAR